MDAEATSDHTPVGDTRDVKRPRRSSSPDLLGRRRSSSSEEPTTKRSCNVANSLARTDGPRSEYLFEDNVAKDQSRVQYGHHYGEVHYHNYQAHHFQEPDRRAGPQSLDEAEAKGKAAEYIARVMNDLSFGCMGLRKTTIAPALANTCQWLLRRTEYIDWRSLYRMCDHHGFMWIKSKPGAGKSTLMKFLLESTQAQYPEEKIVSFFFTARGDANERSLVGMYRHLLHQLLSSVPRLVPYFIDEINALSSQGWQVLPLQNLFRATVLALRIERLTCFIDALDESSEEEIRELVDFFEDLGTEVVARSISFRVCLSSRHYPYVELERCQYLNLDDQYEHQQDISRYIRSKLRPPRGGVPDNILASIQQRAQGVFLWAVLVTQILRKDFQRGDIHKAHERLESIPDGLHNLFHEILHRNLDDPAGSNNLVSVLQIIAFAYRPLTVLELYFALRSEHPDFDISQVWDPHGVDDKTAELFILNCSKGLAELTTIAEKSDFRPPTIQFIHESVRDYWQATGFHALTLRRGRPVVGSAHERLKNCCLRWISNDVLERPRAATLGYKSYYTWYERSRVRDPYIEDVTFLSYALANVFRHAEAACTNGFPQDDFLESFPLEQWCSMAQLTDDWPFVYATPVSLTEILVYKDAEVLLTIELRRNKGRLPSCQRESALRLALSQCDSKSFRMVLESCASSESSVKEKIKTLELAVRKHNIDALELMLKLGTHVIPLPYLAIVLRRAADYGPKDVVKVILDNIEVPTEADAEIKLAIEVILLSACMQGDEAIAQSCLSKSANPNVCIYGNKVSIRACLKKNANLNAFTKSGPIWHAVSAAGHNQILRMLFNHGADPDAAEGRHYYEALLEALHKGCDDIVHTLALQTCTNLLAQPRWCHGEVIDTLVMRSRGDIVSALLKNVEGFRALNRDVLLESLRLAMSRGDNEVVQALKEGGVTLPEETLPKIECAPKDAWVNALPASFFARESVPGLSLLNDESVEDEMV